jgi:peptidoglycan hydrolase-like protein with peptidoglycan-binding domain
MSGGFRGRIGKALALGGGLLVLIGGGAYAVANRGGGGARAGVRPAFATSSTTARAFSPMVTEVTTTTAVQETTTTTEASAAQPQFSGSVKELQQRLADLGYDIGPIDGAAGARTYYTIMAFQKVEGLSRTGEDSADLRDALAKASPPGPMVPGGAANRIEIDLDRQVLFLWRGGALSRILSVSTGNGEYYCTDEGGCDTAITPTGQFRIGRKASGLEVSHLGELWDPMYFYGGIAIHGSPSIPPYPASHGCVRVPMYASSSLYSQVPSGMMVYVVGDGPSASDVEAPPDEPTKPAEPPPPPPPEIPTTTTTVPEAPDVPPPTTTTLPPLTSPTSSSTTTTTRQSF